MIVAGLFLGVPALKNPIQRGLFRSVVWYTTNLCARPKSPVGIITTTGILCQNGPGSDIKLQIIKVNEAR